MKLTEVKTSMTVALMKSVQLQQSGNEIAFSQIDKDDSSCFKPDPFALLIHGTQKKGYFKNLKK